MSFIPRFTTAVVVVTCLFVAADAVAIGLTSTTLLSGSSLTACNGANVNVTGSCTAGLASVMQVVRRVQERNGTRVVPFPLMDRQTAFVQMHPLTWAVNIVAMERLGVQHGYVTSASLTTSTNVLHPDRWNWFHNTTLKAIASNVDAPPSDAWADNIARILTFDGMGFVVLLENNAPNTVPVGPVLRSCIRALKMRSDVLTIVVYSMNSPVSAAMILSESEPGMLPDVILVYGTTSTSTTSNQTKIFTLPLSASLLHIVNVTHGDPLSATVWSESLTIAPGSGDATYYEHQSYLNGLAASAATNDPVLGTSAAMPAHRNGNIRICLGGECPIGRMFAEGMRSYRSSDFAVTSGGAFRGSGWPAGEFRISNLWASMPFANAYCYGKVRGVTLWAMLNYSAALSTAPSPLLTAFGDRLLQLAGIRMTFNADYTFSRLLDVEILNRATGAYEPLDRLKLYSYGTDSYVAQVFAPYPSILSSGLEGEEPPTCTDVLIQTTVTEYMAAIGTFNVSDQGTIRVLTNATAGAAGYPPATTAAQALVQEQASCSPGTVWNAGLATCTACAAGTTSGAAATSCVPIVTREDNTWLIIAIAVPVGVVFVGLIVFWMAWSEMERRRNVRNVDNAPKGGEVTLLFTDIQDSTKLWGTCPSSMSSALEHHHRLIREAIGRHGGYEVKTVGDCFMIAVGSVDSGVSLALDIQHSLQAQAFPRAIRAVYECTAEAELDDVDDDPEDLDDLHPLFNGLRVRIGMHTGVPDVVFDEVTKGYDYYGPPVNVAARVEATARGGQINATRDVTSRLQDRNDVDVVLKGPVELKGVAGLTEILHIVPRDLAGRGAIYAEAEKNTPAFGNDKESASETNDDLASLVSAGPLDHDLMHRFVSSFTAGLKILRPKDRDEMIKKLVKAWRVKAPRDNASNEELLKAIATRATKSMRMHDGNRVSVFLASSGLGGFHHRVSMSKLEDNPDTKQGTA